MNSPVKMSHAIMGTAYQMRHLIIAVVIMGGLVQNVQRISTAANQTLVGCSSVLIRILVLKSLIPANVQMTWHSMVVLVCVVLGMDWILNILLHRQCNTMLRPLKLVLVDL